MPGPGLSGRMYRLNPAEYSKIPLKDEVTLVTLGLRTSRGIKISKKIYISEIIMCYINQYE